MKRVTKYKNTGQQSRDFSATIRLSKKGGGAGSGVDSGGLVQPVTPRACFLDPSLSFSIGTQSLTVRAKAASLSLTIDEFLDSFCIGTSITNYPGGVNRSIGTVFSGVYPIGPQYGYTPPRFDQNIAFCLANDPSTVRFDCSWSPVSGVQGECPPLIYALSDVIFVNFATLMTDSANPLSAVGVLTITCYADGALVETLTITNPEGSADYTCP